MATHNHETACLTLVLSGRYEETIHDRSTWRGAAPSLLSLGETHSQLFPSIGALKLILSPAPPMLVQKGAGGIHLTTFDPSRPAGSKAA
jgi:hypothetical protein